MATVKIVDHYTEIMAVISGDTIAKLNQAGDFVRDTMKNECPVKTGALKKSIRVRRLPKEMAVKVIAGNKKAWYPHLVIMGTVERVTKGRGPIRRKKYTTGVMPPNNFMLRAMNKNASILKALFGKPITIEGTK